MGQPDESGARRKNVTQTVPVRSRPELLVALAAAVCVAGGTGVLVAQHSDSPTAATAPLVTTTPTPSALKSPPPAPRQTPRPSPTRPRATHQAAAKPFLPLPAGPVQPQPCPVPPVPPGSPAPFPPPVVAESAVPAPVALPRVKVDLHVAGGKGMWLTTWPASKPNAAEVVNRAKSAGLRQIWVRTGGTKQGYYGDALLASLLPRAHAAGLAVIAWDFPYLSDPLADVDRAVRALSFTVGGERIDGFAPDIETKAEGVHVSAKRFRAYLSRVKVAAGNRPIVLTVPRPTPLRLKTYPYAVTASYVDAYTAMIYWSCLEPGATTKAAISELRKLHRPVAVVGQAYDMGPEGGRHGLPTAAETWRFLDVAKRAGAFGASLYTYDTAGPNQWRPLQAYPWR